MIQFIKLTVLLLLLICVTACRPDSPHEPIVLDEPEITIEVTPIETIASDDPVALSFDGVLSEINRSRILIKPDEEVLRRLAQDRERKTIEMIEMFVLEPEHMVFPEAITYEEAVYDTDMFFDLLRHQYGAYTFFGGDEVFLPIYEGTKEELRSQELWGIYAYSRLLRNRISDIINDNHFILGFDVMHQRLGKSYNTFVWETPFDKTEQGFCQRETGLYVVELTGHEMDEVFRLAVDEAGDFFYVPIIMTADNRHSYNLSVIYGNGTEETIVLRPLTTELIENDGTSLYYEGDIPVVTVRSSNPQLPELTPEEMEYLSQLETFGEIERFYSERSNKYPISESEEGIRFLSYAEELRDAPVIIIDNRSNLGGDITLPNMWLHRLTGEMVPNSYVILAPDYFFEKTRDDDEIFFPSTSIGNHYAINVDREHIVPSDQLIIMLIDRHVFSTGERFTDLLLNMENTLIIGQNTYGGHISNYISAFYLPYSRTLFQMGDLFFMHPEDRFREGIGIAPDIWVVGDALTAALAMLNGR